MIVTLNTRSNITIPASVRKKLGIKDGDTLDVNIKDGRIVLTPVAVIPKKIFLTPSGINKEKTATAQIKKGQTKPFLTAEELIEDLHETR